MVRGLHSEKKQGIELSTKPKVNQSNENTEKVYVQFGWESGELE